MATLVFGAVGTLVGGPFGGALGALIGQQVDQAIIGSDTREGPRLKDLSVTTSTYGSAIPHIHGTMRMPGTILWATEIRETSATEGGGKGKPSVTTYSYSASFAVALASRPIERVGRIWADGSLLRGAGGDLKTGGSFRLHNGWADQPPDTLLAAADPNTPAYRGCAYAVFEDLALGDFGSRIPALTFEIVGSTGTIHLLDMVRDAPTSLEGGQALEGMQGFAIDGGPLAATIGALSQLYPLVADSSGDALTLSAPANVNTAPILLPEAAALQSDDGFAPRSGIRSETAAAQRSIARALRYYDTGRDYQPGIQRAGGRPPAGPQQIIELPAALASTSARTLIDDAARRGARESERIAWRTVEIDPAIGPGRLVSVPGRTGTWLVESWEWRDGGVELELVRMARPHPATSAPQPAPSPGFVAPPDLVSGPTILQAFELPSATVGANTSRVFAAASSPAPGWRGAALYAQVDEALTPLGPTGARRAVVGATLTSLDASPALTLERGAMLEVELAANDLVLASASADALLGGANRAVIGGEIIQFAKATRIDAARWRLTGLLRGRGGTEAIAAADTPAGKPFALLDAAILSLDGSTFPASADALAAIGLADPDPISSAIAARGASLAPLCPVHARRTDHGDGAVTLRWTRRVRGGWKWAEGSPPIGEASEAWLIGVGPVERPFVLFEAQSSAIAFDPVTWSALGADHPGQTLWVRQLGDHGRSPALHLTTLP